GLSALGDAAAGPLVVVADGEIVLTVGDVAAPTPLFSIGKGVTGMVAARLIETGAIPGGLDAVVPPDPAGAWAEYPGDATIRMFLSMTSDFGLPAPRRPGRRYAYGNHAIDFLGGYLARCAGNGKGRMDEVVLATLFHVTGHEDPVSFRGQWGGWY